MLQPNYIWIGKLPMPSLDEVYGPVNATFCESRYGGLFRGPAKPRMLRARRAAATRAQC